MHLPPALKKFFEAALAHGNVQATDGAGQREPCETVQEIWDCVSRAEEGYVHVDKKATFWIRFDLTYPKMWLFKKKLTDYTDNEFAEQLLSNIGEKN